MRRKALIIGINYYGSKYELSGCINDARNVREYLVRERGFSGDPYNMVFMTDEPGNRGGPYEPTGYNMMNAFRWLVTGNQPGDSCWLSYSGHGGQVKSPEADRELDDTICPVDFQQTGQITSDTLHKVLVSLMSPHVRLTVLFDCCHSGSAIELPYVYRPDANGNVNLVDNIRQGMNLLGAASNLIQGGFTAEKVRDAQALFGGAKSFFHSLRHPAEPANADGLAQEYFEEDWKNEGKDVWMFSGCADDQTSADTKIAGEATGAMSWALIQVLRQNPNLSYLQILQNTRGLIRQRYSQVPQLSVGGEYDLNQRIYF